MVTAVIDESHDWWMSHPSVQFTAQDHTHRRPQTAQSHPHTHTHILFEMYSNSAAGIPDKD